MKNISYDIFTVFTNSDEDLENRSDKDDAIARAKELIKMENVEAVAVDEIIWDDETQEEEVNTILQLDEDDKEEKLEEDIDPRSVKAQEELIEKVKGNEDALEFVLKYADFESEEDDEDTKNVIMNGDSKLYFSLDTIVRDIIMEGIDLFLSDRYTVYNTWGFKLYTTDSFEEAVKQVRGRMEATGEYSSIYDKELMGFIDEDEYDNIVITDEDEDDEDEELDENLIESSNPLKDAAEKHKKKQDGIGAFVNLNAGDVEKGNAMFNNVTDVGSAPTSGGMGESIEKSNKYTLYVLWADDDDGIDYTEEESMPTLGDLIEYAETFIVPELNGGNVSHAFISDNNGDIVWDSNTMEEDLNESLVDIRKELNNID